MTDEERSLLAAYAVHNSMAAVFGGGKPGLPTGKTVGEMIEEQRKLVAQEKEEEERQKKLAAEVAAQQAQMRNTIGVALLGFKQKEGFMSDYIEVQYAYENRSDKDVRAFEGEVAYKDILGNDLEEVQLKVLTPITSGAKASTTNKLPFMVYGKLRGKKMDDVKIEWRPKKILFADGSETEVSSQQ